MRVRQNFFASVFTDLRFVALVTSAGAEFHNLVESPIKVFEVLFSLNFSHATLLVIAPFFETTIYTEQV